MIRLPTGSTLTYTLFPYTTLFRSYVCRVPPLMICDLLEAVPAIDLRDPANAGRMIRLKSPQSGSTTWAPGNFGLLALPDGRNGASAIKDAIAAVEPDGCYGGEVTTAPGSKTVKVQGGVNARFDLPGGDGEPASNVINYPRDEDMTSSGRSEEHTA